MSEHTIDVENTPEKNEISSEQDANNDSLVEAANPIHIKTFEEFEQEELERQALLDGVDNSGKKKVKTSDGNVYISVDDITPEEKIHRRNGFSARNPELYMVEKPNVSEMPDGFNYGNAKTDIFTGYEKFIRRNPLSTSKNLIYRKNKIKISQNKKLLMRKYREERRERIRKAGNLKVSIAMIAGVISFSLIYFLLNKNSDATISSIAWFTLIASILMIFRSKAVQYLCTGYFVLAEFMLITWGFVPYLGEFGFSDNLFISIGYILTFILLITSPLILVLSSDVKAYFTYIAPKKY